MPSPDPADGWLIERGIGETRFARIAGGEIVEARVLIDGVVPAGSRIGARLLRSGRPAVARSGSLDYLLPAGAPGVTEGAGLTIEVTREPIPGGEPWKRPLARPAPDDGSGPPPLPNGTEIDRAASGGLAGLGWDDLVDQARSGVVGFAGGELRLFAAPAMTLIDVDGRLPPLELALAAASASARAIGQLGIGGSIGIDFPTVGGKADRQKVAAVIDRELTGPFERTAVNGFGFLQIVRPRRHASLIELAADRAAFEARDLLRRASQGTGAVRLAAHPAVIAAIEAGSGWVEQLSRTTGGRAHLRADPAIPIHGGHVETI